MRLQSRLLLVTVSTAIIAIVVVLAVSFALARTALEDAARDKFLAMQAARHHSLVQYFGEFKAKLDILAQSPTTFDALTTLSRIYTQMGTDAQYQLQQSFAVTPRDRNIPLDSVRDAGASRNDAYGQAHARFHSHFLSRYKAFDWDDIFLIDPKGNVVYTMFKESDFATNVLSGPWRDSGLARAVVPLLHDAVPGVASFADFTRYAPSGSRPAAFLALPVFDPATRAFLGVVATQLPGRPLNQLMNDQTGLGKSGETFVVGPDGWMLTDSRFEAESTVLKRQLKTEAVTQVLAGREGVIGALDYRGVPVFVAFKPIMPFEGSVGDRPLWGVVAKIDQAEALAGVQTMMRALSWAGFVISLIAVAVGVWGARSVSRPLLGIQAALVTLARGEATEVPGLERHDEIGAMAKAAESFRQMALQIEHSHWIHEHVAGLATVVSSQPSMREAPDAILRYLCERLGMPVGSLYLLDETGAYVRAGAHGVIRRSQADDCFAAGVGLVGQCARDKQPLVLSPVPDDAAVISSGLVEFSAHELVLYPVLHKERTLAVLELAALTPVTPRQHECLAAACAGLGLHLANLQGAEHNRLLLEETRRQAIVTEDASRYARSLIEASLDPLVTISADGKIMDVNRATENVTGVSREQLVGSDFSDYFVEPERARAGYRQAFLQGSVADYALAIRHVSGKVTDVLYNACVYHDSEGKVAGVFAAARDVTEQKHQAIAMEEASRYTRSLIEASLDPLVTISTEGKIMDVNRATEVVTGVSRERLIGSDFCDYFTEPERARAGYRQVFSQGSVEDYALALRHASGKVTDVLYNASVYSDREGKVAGVFAAARDVTEQKRQQEELRHSNEEMRALTEELRSQSEEFRAQNEELRANQEELRAQQDEVMHKNQALEVQGRQLEQARQEAESKAEELERANRYKSEFLANMSHELRTPLNSVLILAKDLSENAEGNLSADQVESATVIHESGNQLLTLINDILDLSKIEAGRLEVQAEDFLLADVFAYLRRVFSPLAEKKGVAFALDAEAGLPESFRGDQQRLIQVLTNLLSNAVKFTDAGSVKLAVAGEEGFLRFDVTDTGIGIPPDKLELIFAAFQQMDGSTARKYGGSGLGLTISRRLTELMGGEISVASTPGLGSTFTVRLPLSHRIDAGASSRPFTEPVSPLPTRNLPGRSGARILIVEDDARLVTILERLIDALGLATVCVDSGEKALAQVASKRPTGILLDLGLPGIQGMDVLRGLKDDPSTASIPVYIMSGAEDTGEAKTLGALGFLKKPVTRDAIAMAVHGMVEHSVAIPRRVLLVEDRDADVRALRTLFRNDPLELLPAKSGEEGMEQLRHGGVDAVILDLMLPDISGFDWLKHASAERTLPPVVVYSGRELNEDELLQLREHADAVVTKGKSNTRLREEVLLALSGGKRVAASSKAAASPQLGKRLLLVDDDVRNLFALAKALRGKGYAVDVAGEGGKALEMLGKERFDAVLTDIMMPGMDGYALIRLIREAGYAELPLIAITAKAMPGDVDLCLDAGANDYVAKPVDVGNLLTVLGKWL